MSASPLFALFGESTWADEPWFQYDAGQVKEVSDAALAFLHYTIGLHGLLHDQHGYIVDMDSWSALVQYVRWCDEQNLDFLFHCGKLEEGDPFYTQLATSKLQGYLHEGFGS
jgi:hypothetical protein